MKFVEMMAVLETGLALVISMKDSGPQ